MGDNTTIAWADATFNPWIGCTKVSPGCDHCYAESQDNRWGNDSWGKGKPRRITSDANWKKPLQWQREALLSGKRHKVFCASLADVMDDEAPAGARERLWELIDATPNLIWQLLTKRPHRYLRYLPAEFKHGNVWLGTSAENQEYYDARWPQLRAAAACHHLKTFISYEPALGPLSPGWWKINQLIGLDKRPAFPNWIICGGESGHGRRPMEIIWAEALAAECSIEGIAFFMKQLSARTPHEGAALIPAHLLVRQFPE
ncbi:MAG TPA: DUF5131 family protein [Candidatus Acidoferrales bacterium]|nr:DUF5131 family protein [Candidatus Acidoferrales bacterium]